jgi:uncharacterized coiled-coil protein SlyX
MTETGRLEAIEIKLAHLERAITDISDVVARQQRELDLVRLSAAEIGRQEKPPHY